MFNKQGLFISLEGPDGSGKTSALEAVMPQIQDHYPGTVIFTREPGGSAIAEAIRHVILNPDFTQMDVRTEALLFAAQRRQHITEVIAPALERGSLVITDRFVDSSLVYQGVARGIGIEEVADLNHFATEGLTPDLTLYFDLSAEEGLERIEAGRGHRQYDRLDQEKLAFHQAVVRGYEEVLSAYPDRVRRIDASLSPEAVADQVWAILKDFI